MSKHTPGPWIVSRETTRGQFVTETHIRGPREDHIALVGPCEIDANARLIAAAPELLEALLLCYKYVNGGHNLYPGLHYEAYIAARAVLAKIEEQRY
jgi:hypothetical protein